MKKLLPVLASAMISLLPVKHVSAMSKEAMQKEEVAVLEIPELAGLASPGELLPKEMEVQSYSLGASHDVVGSSVTKNVVFQDMCVTRVSDEWQPLLMKAAIEGTKFKHAILEIKHPHASTRMEFSDIVITSVSSSDNIPASGSDGYLYINYSFQGIAMTQTKDHFKGSASLKNPPKIFSASGALL